MQKIDLLGMSLTDYTLKEAQGIAERYLRGGVCNSIVFLSAKMLVGAGINRMQKQWLEDVDLIAWSDAEILKKAGVTSKARIHDVENREFLKSYLKTLAKSGQTIYLLSDSESELERFRQDLFHLRGDLRIIGEMVVEEDVTDYDAVVNALNIVAPKVIISKMAYDRLEVMMTNYRKYLNAEVWIAMNDQMNLNEERRNLLRVLADRWYHMLLYKHVEEYEQKKENENVKSSSGE